jgi:hypothetical protein
VSRRLVGQTNWLSVNGVLKLEEKPGLSSKQPIFVNRYAFATDGRSSDATERP